MINLPLAALGASLLLAWLNFLLTGKWAALPGALNGWRQPWYAAALIAATVLTIAARRRVGEPTRIGRAASAGSSRQAPRTWPVTTTGTGRLRNLDFLGGEVELTGVAAGTPVRVRANYYPAWRARVGGRDVPLHSGDGQIEFAAPDAGTYVVRLEYPRYRWLSLIAIAALIGGAWALTRNITLRRPSAVV